MSGDLIREGRKLLDEATPGPWEVRQSGDGFKIGNSQHYDGAAGNYDYEEGGIIDEEDVDLIVWARNNLPALLDQLEVSMTKLTRIDLALDSAHGDMVYVDDIQSAMDGK